MIPTESSASQFVSVALVTRLLASFTVYPLRSGSFKSEFFTDDGESFAYKTGDCVHLLFTVDCDSEYVRVRIENIGEKSFTPDIVLCDADDRILTVE